MRQIDMRDAGEVEAVAACVAQYRGVDILVNNVGGSEPGGPVEMAVEMWDEQIALNLRQPRLSAASSCFP